MKTSLALFALASIAPLVSAGIGVETYGTAAPPASVAGWPMHRAPFRDDVFADVTETDDGSGGLIQFSTPLSVRRIGMGWAVWSHGYTGNAYVVGIDQAPPLIMTLGVGTQAFQFYASPNSFSVIQISATGSDGAASVSSPQFPVGFAGATGWGFYGTGGAGVVSVAVSCDIAFAVGEFACGKVPAPCSFALLGLGGLIAGRRRQPPAR